MKVKVECAVCGRALDLEYEDNNEVLKVHPCQCTEGRDIKAKDGILFIGED